MLYTLNPHSAGCQLQLNKIGKKEKLMSTYKENYRRKEWKQSGYCTDNI